MDDVCELLRKVYGNQAHFVDGDEELVPGLSVRKVGGHSAGLMCVRVWTQRGWVVMASVCANFYENSKARNPFVIVYNLGEMLNRYTTMELLAESSDHIILGHDPLVMKYYPAASKELEGIVARLDLSPTLT